MTPVYSLVLALDPRAGESSAGCFDQLVSAATGWVEEAHPGFRVRTDGSTDSPAAGETVIAHRERIDASHDLFTLEWSRVADGGTTRLSSTVELGRTVVGIQGRAAVQAGAVGGLAPVQVDPVRPAVVDRWCRVAVPRAMGGEELPAGVRVVSPRFVGGFVDDLLLAPQRVLPLVVLTPLDATARPLADPQVVFDAVSGLAHVIELTHKDATFELTKRVGKEWSVFLGGVRLYWPQPTLDDNFRRHPLFLPSDFRDAADAADRLPGLLLAKLCAAALARFADPPPLVRQARAAQEKGRQTAVQKQIAVLTAGAAESTQWLALLESAWEDNRKLKEEVAFAREELAEVKAERDDLREQWKTVAPEMAAAEDAAVRAEAITKRYRDRILKGMKRVSEAVDLAADEFADTLRFLPSAVHSAEDSPYQYPVKVYELLRALDEVARALRARGGLGESVYDALRRHGFEYKPHISVTSEGKYGGEYTFEYQGRKQLFEQHVTLGSSHSPRECLSVHWVRDEPAGRFVVGWCGRHKTNTRS